MNSESIKKNKSPAVIFNPVVIFDILCLFFGVFFLLESRHIRRGFQQVLDARVYPIVVASMFCLAIFLHLFKNLRSCPREDKDDDNSGSLRSVAFKVSSLFVLFVGYILFIKKLGFFETGFLFLWSSISVLGETSLQWVLKSLALAFVIISATYVVFGVLLNIYVPPGLIIH